MWTPTRLSRRGGGTRSRYCSTPRGGSWRRSGTAPRRSRGGSGPDLSGENGSAMRGRSRTILAVLALSVASFARAERLPVQRHGVAEGLAEETVTALLKESRGSLSV